MMLVSHEAYSSTAPVAFDQSSKKQPEIRSINIKLIDAPGFKTRGWFPCLIER